MWMVVWEPGATSIKVKMFFHANTYINRFLVLHYAGIKSTKRKKNGTDAGFIGHYPGAGR